ncbi:7532_t:CDS:2 [Ambispora gerdemannii]|uniref:7532_t:CDS:1 n=1 Tax=Ambispora gerdemannii TaxID=144530 RepID=A0A9N8ZPW2_9GLOM|nr:7532_t:CDS:2 [Ambispora gerdemannii]
MFPRKSNLFRSLGRNFSRQQNNASSTGAVKGTGSTKCQETVFFILKLKIQSVDDSSLWRNQIDTDTTYVFCEDNDLNKLAAVCIYYSLTNASKDESSSDFGIHLLTVSSAVYDNVIYRPKFSPTAIFHNGQAAIRQLTPAQRDVTEHDDSIQNFLSSLGNQSIRASKGLQLILNLGISPNDGKKKTPTEIIRAILYTPEVLKDRKWTFTLLENKLWVEDTNKEH